MWIGANIKIVDTELIIYRLTESGIIIINKKERVAVSFFLLFNL